MRGALSYNEHKVREGNAELLLASRFGADIDELGFSQKLKRFELLNSNSTRFTNNTIHISLNFPPEENLDDETLQNIAMDYMQRVGFSSQPFLVYRHDDTSHPHIHIITTPILPNGKSIYLHNIAKEKSEPARIAIEEQFSLIKAQSRKINGIENISPASITAAFYGAEETKKTISNIVTEVTTKYNYTSVEELNAILRQYNVVADRGSEGTKLFNNKGLLYSIVDSDGYKIGVPTKASSILSNPTLAVLERKFLAHTKHKIAAGPFVKKRVSNILLRNNDVTGLMKDLESKQIKCTVKFNPDNSVKGLAFIDKISKTVFTNEELGIDLNTLLQKINYPSIKSGEAIAKNEKGFETKNEKTILSDMQPSIGILKDLLSVDAAENYLPENLFKKKRKRKKRK